MIALYTGWIAALHHYEPNLFAAWFNLGVELRQAGAAAEAIGAYRDALRTSRTSMGRHQPRPAAGAGRASPTRRCRPGIGAMQPDAARIALLNQRGAAAWSSSGRLAEAEATLRRSLLTDPAQPDAVQHWVHMRQKMCLWPVLDETIPGPPARRICWRNAGRSRRWR